MCGLVYLTSQLKGINPGFLISRCSVRWVFCASPASPQILTHPPHGTETVNMEEVTRVKGHTKGSLFFKNNKAAKHTSFKKLVGTTCPVGIRGTSVSKITEAPTKYVEQRLWDWMTGHRYIRWSAEVDADSHVCGQSPEAEEQTAGRTWRNSP